MPAMHAIDKNDYTRYAESLTSDMRTKRCTLLPWNRAGKQITRRHGEESRACSRTHTQSHDHSLARALAHKQDAITQRQPPSTAVLPSLTPPLLTRWASSPGNDVEWFEAQLQDEHSVCGATIVWELARAAIFDILVKSSGAKEWEKAYSFSYENTEGECPGEYHGIRLINCRQQPH